MKVTIISIFLLLSMATPSRAQMFTIGPDSVEVSGSYEELFLEAHTTLLNTQDTAINVAWKRTIIVQPDEWINYLCSDFLCFLPENNSGNIYVLPNQEMDVNMTFFPQDVAGIGEVMVTFWDTTDMAGTAVQIRYTCIAEMTTSTVQADGMFVSLFPNPVTNRLHLSNAHLIEQVSISSIDGTFLPVTKNANALFVSHLTPGFYIARIRLRSGIELVRKFVKR